MRKEFCLLDQELEELLDACKPTPVMYLSGGIPMFNTPQENANYAWKKLADKYGFIWDTAKPVMGKGERYFTAEQVDKNEQ